MVLNHGLIPLSCDIRDEDAISRSMDDVRPDVVLHLAGYSDPDYCEDPAHLDDVVAVNFVGATNVFRACANRKVICVYLSTSQIFPGNTFLGFGGTFKEGSKPARKMNRYALSKLSAEAARLAFTDRVKIVRTSHLFDYPRLVEKFGPSKTYAAPTFIKRSYMYLPHFANSMMQYLYRVVDMPPVLHMAGTLTVSEYELLRMFLQLVHMPGYKLTKRNHEIDGLAPRPHYSGLDVGLSKKLGLPQVNYIDGLLELSHTLVRG